jgi:hypothetical protein
VFSTAKKRHVKFDRVVDPAKMVRPYVAGTSGR